MASLREVELQVPLRVETRDGLLIANFGEMRRMPVRIEEVPACIRHAFLAAEDARFYEHPGIDWRGIFRAVWLLGTGHEGRVPGGSTITQQVARNFFLSSEYKIKRKLSEILGAAHRARTGKGRDPAVVPEQDFPRPPVLRHRRGRRFLLRQDLDQLV